MKWAKPKNKVNKRDFSIYGDLIVAASVITIIAIIGTGYLLSIDGLNPNEKKLTGMASSDIANVKGVSLASYQESYRVDETKKSGKKSGSIKIKGTLVFPESFNPSSIGENTILSLEFEKSSLNQLVYSFSKATSGTIEKKKLVFQEKDSTNKPYSTMTISWTDKLLKFDFSGKISDSLLNHPFGAALAEGAASEKKKLSSQIDEVLTIKLGANNVDVNENEEILPEIYGRFSIPVKATAKGKRDGNNLLIGSSSLSGEGKAYIGSAEDMLSEIKTESKETALDLALAEANGMRLLKENEFALIKQEFGEAKKGEKTQTTLTLTNGKTISIESDEAETMYVIGGGKGAKNYISKSPEISIQSFDNIDDVRGKSGNIERIDEAVVEESENPLADNSSVPVIIEFNLPDKNFYRMEQGILKDKVRKEKTISERTANFNKAKASLASNLANKNFKIKQDLKIINGIAADIPRETLSLLQKDPSIKRIELAKRYNIILDESLDEIHARDVWPIFDDKNNHLTGAGMRIAIIDTGVDYNHPDLGNGCFKQPSCKVIDGYDFANKDSDPMDDNGHGTHVAATAAGKKGSPTGLDGVAPDAKILAYKVCDSTGYCWDSDIIKAIERATDPNGDGDSSDHVEVASMSLGGGGDPDDALSRAVDASTASGVVHTIAAGNSGPYASTIDSPGTARSAITVAAACKSSQIGKSSWCAKPIADFSSRGPLIWNGENIKKPDIAAPGVDICAARWDNAFGSYATPCFDDKHMRISGTSMATPHVAGAVALIRQAFPEYTPAQVKELLKKNARNLEAGMTYNDQGAGLVDLQKAIPGFKNIKADPNRWSIDTDPTRKLNIIQKDFSVTSISSDINVLDISFDLDLNIPGISVSSDKYQLQVPNKSTDSFKLTITVDNDQAKLGLHMGAIVLSGDNGKKDSIPVFVNVKPSVIVSPRGPLDYGFDDPKLDFWVSDIINITATNLRQDSSQTLNINSSSYPAGITFEMPSSLVIPPGSSLDFNTRFTVDNKKVKNNVYKGFLTLSNNANFIFLPTRFIKFYVLSIQDVMENNESPSAGHIVIVHHAIKKEGYGFEQLPNSKVTIYLDDDGPYNIVVIYPGIKVVNGYADRFVFKEDINVSNTTQVQINRAEAKNTVRINLVDANNNPVNKNLRKTMTLQYGKDKKPIFDMPFAAPSIIIDFFSNMSDKYWLARTYYWSKQPAKEMYHVATSIEEGLDGNKTFSYTPENYTARIIKSYTNNLPSLPALFACSELIGWLFSCVNIKSDTQLKPPVSQTLYTLVSAPPLAIPWFDPSIYFLHTTHNVGCSPTDACPLVSFSPRFSSNDNATINNGLGPPFFTSRFVNGETRIELDRAFCQMSFARQKKSYAKHDAVPYEIYNGENIKIAEGKLPASAASLNYYSFCSDHYVDSSDSTIVNVSQPGYYEVKIDFPYEILGQEMNGRVVAKFNTSNKDNDPPHIIALEYYNDDELSEIYNPNTTNKIRIRLSDYGDVKDMNIAYSTDGVNFIPVSVAKPSKKPYSPYYAAEFPSIENLTKFTISLAATDTSNNELSYTFELLPRGIVLPPPTYTLSVSKSGTGSGTITSSPAAINCGADCSESYLLGDSVALIVSPNGSRFTGWLGDCSGTRQTCTLTMNSTKSVVAVFEKKLISDPQTPWQDNSYGDYIPEQGLSVNYALGYHFTPLVDGHITKLGGLFKGTMTVKLFNKFTGNLLASAPVSSNKEWNYVSITPVNVNANTTYTIAAYYLVNSNTSYSSRYFLDPPLPQVFGDIHIEGGTSIKTDSDPNKVPTNVETTKILGQPDIEFVQGALTPTLYQLAVFKSGSGSGIITSSPIGINCGADCSESYASGTLVNLTATPSAGSTFAGWSGDCSGIGNCVLMMTSNKSATAIFALSDTTPPTVSIISPTNNATVSGTITTSTNASDNVGVTKVEFYRDSNILLGIDTTSPYSISWDSTAVPDGAHTLFAKAYDAAGLSAISPEISITISNAPLPVGAQTPWKTNGYGNLISQILSNDYALGYHFTPLKDGKIVGLGGYFKATKPVKLFDKTSGELLASTTITSNDNWAFVPIMPVNVQAGKTYTLAAYHKAGDYYSYRSKLNPILPQTFVDIRIEGGTFLPTSDQNIPPTNLQTATVYGQPDIEFVPSNDSSSPSLGFAKIKRVGSDDTTASAPATEAWVDSMPHLSANPADFTNISIGSHIAYATDVAGYTETAGICEYDQGNAECSVTAFTAPITCNGFSCQTSIDINSNRVTQVVFKYLLPADTTPPTVSITSPSNNAFVKGTTTITASASDNVGISKVEFYKDSDALPFYTDSISPYSASLDTTTLPDGSHAVKAKAYDTANLNASTSISIIVDNALPTISIVNPKNNNNISGTIKISASTSDSISGIKHVEFYRDSSIFLGLDTIPPYETSFDTETIPDGSHNLYAKAYDKADNIAQSTAINVKVINDIEGQSSIQTPWKSNEYGNLYTNKNWDYSMGYIFTPLKDGRITKLGGYFNGTKTVKLFKNSTLELLASATVSSNNDWSYASITPVNVNADTAYIVAAYLEGTGASYRSLPISNKLPKIFGDIRIEGGAFISTSTNPDAIPTKTTTTRMYGQTDIEFVQGALPPTLYQLSVSKSGSGNGIITSSPIGINCGADCSESYNQGTSVTLTATPAAGSNFAGWSGDCFGAGCTLTMNSNKLVTASFNLISQPSNNTPNVSITQPKNGDLVKGTISIKATASNATKVEFYKDSDALPFYTDSISPYSASLDTMTLPDGSHAVKAKAYNSFGSNSHSIKVTVNNTPPSSNDTIAPSVSITYPLSRSYVDVDTNINIKASASDNVGVIKVEFYEKINDPRYSFHLVCTDTAPPYTCNIKFYTTNPFQLQAKAYDAAGNTKNHTINIYVKE